MTTTFWRTVPLLMAITAFGCGSGGEPMAAPTEQADMTGTVTTADGRPLKTAAIHFSPVTPGVGLQEELAAVTDGKFTTRLPVAEYKVAFDIAADARSVVPGQYRRFDTSKLTTTVKAGMESPSYTLK